MLEETFSELERARLEKLYQMQEEGIDPFPTRAKQTHTSQEAIDAFTSNEEKGDTTPIQVTLAGRLRALEDRDGRVQLFFRINDIGEKRMRELGTYYDLGDFIQASGYMFRTRRGEVTLYVEDFKMLAKALRPLPAAKDEIVNGEIIRHATLSDPETRYRQRYVDLAVNPDIQEVFKTRAATIRALRNFLDQHANLI